MKCLLLLLVLVSSTALAKPSRAQKELLTNLSKLLEVRIPSVRGDKIIKPEELLKGIFLDTRRITSSISVALQSENNGVEILTKLYKNKQKLTPLNLHDHLTELLTNKSDGLGLLVAQYSSRHLAMYEFIATDGKIELEAPTYYEIKTTLDKSLGERVTRAEETALLKVLMEDEAEIPEGDRGNVAFVRLFDYYTQGMSADKLKEFAADIQRSFFPDTVAAEGVLAASSGDAGEGEGAFTVPNKYLNPDYNEVGKAVTKKIEQAEAQEATAEAQEAKPQVVKKEQEQEVPVEQAQETETLGGFLDNMIKARIEAGEFSSKKELSKKIGKSLRYYTKPKTVPLYNKMMSLVAALVPKLALSDAELDKLIALWKRDAKKALTAEQQQDLDALVASLKSGGGAQEAAEAQVVAETQVAEEAQAQEAEVPVEQTQDAEVTFSSFLNKKRQASGLTARGLSNKLALYETAISDYSNDSKYPLYNTMTKMLKNGLAAELALSDAEIDKLIALWKRDAKKPLTAEQQKDLDELVVNLKSGIVQEAEAQVVAETQVAEEVPTQELAAPVEATQGVELSLSDLSAMQESLNASLAVESNELVQSALENARLEIETALKTKAQEQLTNTIAQEGMSLENIEDYVIGDNSFLAIFREKVSEAIAAAEKSGKSFHEVLEKNTAITAAQLNKLLAGETVLTIEEYRDMCVYTQLSCGGGEEHMLRIERVLDMLRQEEMKVVIDHLPEDTQQTLEEANNTWKGAWVTEEGVEK